jgi:hypothetical protein
MTLKRVHHEGHEGHEGRPSWRALAISLPVFVTFVGFVVSLNYR